MQKLKLYILSLLAVILIAGSAHAVSIRGRDISTITDVLRQARGLTSRDTSLELKKEAILRLHDDGQLDLRYSIGKDDKDSSLGQIKNYYSKATNMQDNGFLSVLSRTKFGGNKILVASSKALSWYSRPVYSNWFYELYFMTVSKNDSGDISQSRFGSWRYPDEWNGANSGYIKDIKTGIFVQDFDGELVVAATMESKNDNPITCVDYSTKTVNTRLDFWALFTNASGDVQYKKIDNLTKTESGFDTAPLNGVVNASDGEWSSKNNLRNTTASPYMIIKTAAGDFNNDSYENEVAVLAADRLKIYLWLYQIEYNKQTASFTIKTMKDKTEVFTYRNPDYFKTWSYNGLNRTPGADIVAGDFDGDGIKEIAVIFQGDFPQNERDRMYFGGTVKTLHANLYKWNNNKGDFDVTANEEQAYDKREIRGIEDDAPAYDIDIYMPWGGIKAAVVDVEGDGKDEIAFAYYRWDYRHTEVSPMFGTPHWHEKFVVCPYLSLVKIDTDGKLKSEQLDRFFDGYQYRLVDKFYQGDFSTPPNLQEYMLAPGDIPQNGSLYPLVDREISIASGAFFGQNGTIKERGDIALRVYGGKMILLKSDGTTLNQEQTLDAYGTSALAAGDFAGEGIELGRPTRIVREHDRSYVAVIQAPPYHIDTISADGKTVVPNPTNFSYVNGGAVSYSNKNTETNIQMTKFDMHSSVETIFAMDSDLTRNVVGGLKKVGSLYGTVKNVAQVIPGTSSFQGIVDKTEAVEGAVSGVFNFLNSLTDKVETIKQGYDKELQEQTVLKTITSTTDDTLAYVQANQYIWRYPIVTKPAPNLHIMSDDAKFLTKKDFVTFTLYDDATPYTALTDSQYQPIHEKGNLFSYPSAIGNIEGYNNKQKALSSQESIQFGAQVSGASNFKQIKENETTESKKVTAGFISQALSLVDGIFGTDLAQIPAEENGPTYTRKESTSEQISWTLPNAATSILGNSSYNINYQAYVADNGAVVCGFAVNKFDPYRDLFNTESIYNKLPDPSFVLPNKFILSKRRGSYAEFEANSQRMNAMEMRGVRFYAVDFNRYTTSRLLKEARYRVEIPIYNASFLPANNVKVNLYWVKDRSEEALSSRRLIGTQYVSMAGWSDLGNNKAWARFAFNPKNIPSNKSEEHYQLYAVIDPDGSLAEVHETRDLAVDSGGNNEGYFEFSVEGIESTVTAGSFGASYAGGVRASLTKEEWENLTSPTLLINGEDSYVNFYNKYIKDSEGPVEVELTITNNEEITLPAIYLQASYQDTEANITDTIYSQKIVLFPNETYMTHFVLDGASTEKLRELGSQWTWIHYDLAGTFFSTEELDALMTGDYDPELEIFSGDADADTSNDETAYYDTVITQTYELSHDAAVYWKIDGISDVITNVNTEDTYVKDSALPVLPAKPEEFSLSWNPSDAQTVKTSTANLTVSTIPGVTRAGQYAFRIQISDDGETWTEKQALIFGNVSGSSSSGSLIGVSSSSSGCDSGLSVLCLGLILFAAMKRKSR